MAHISTIGGDIETKEGWIHLKNVIEATILVKVYLNENQRAAEKRLKNELENIKESYDQLLLYILQNTVNYSKD